MAFDQSTRNRLSKFVTDTRKLLSDEFAQQMREVFGLDPATGEVTDLDKLPTLGDSDRQTASMLRDTLDHYLASNAKRDKKTITATLDRIVREQAFTVLNRLCAVRMAEARDLVVESIAKGTKSKGFQLYARLAGTSLGETGDSYVCYLLSLFDELSVDLPVLFDRYSISGRLFPRESVLLDVLSQLNHHDLDQLWGEDETIGWIYQYFNSQEERKAMRDASSAPRDSRELAVRNQFFTPRYVVEFLTDNTLGRIWYEMTQGETQLKESCRYLVRRPTEIFLAAGEQPPESLAPLAPFSGRGAGGEGSDAPIDPTTRPSTPSPQTTGARGSQNSDRDIDLSQEQLLNQPVHIPHRPLKDPREIKMLDPACGSMHFGLYAFDLFLRIYEEAWDIEERQGQDAFTRPRELKSLHETYGSRESFILDVPRLIIERNIHGIDIDARAVQIAGLSLWLRAQKAWYASGVKPLDRPRVTKSNIVCAEPMPGESDLLEQFITDHLSQTSEKQTIASIVRRVFDAMKLAGEAGSLLKIEEEISGTIAEAKKKWVEGPVPVQLPLFEIDRNNKTAIERPLLIAGIDDASFWEEIEERIYIELKNYAVTATSGGSFQRRLFSEDAARGFAFIDVCKYQYDVVLANPPFGDVSQPSQEALDILLASSGRDIGAAFVRRFANRLNCNSLMGFVLPTPPLFKPVFEQWRRDFFLGQVTSLKVAVQLGGQVLDKATVAASAVVFAKAKSAQSFVVRATTASEDETNCAAITSAVLGLLDSQLIPGESFLVWNDLACCLLGAPFAYWISTQLLRKIQFLPSIEGVAANVKQGTATADEPRFSRAWWEVPVDSKEWVPYTKSSEYSPLWDEILWVGRFGDNMVQLSSTGKARVQGVSFFGKPGVTFPSKSVIGFNPRLQPRGCAFGHSGSVAFPILISPTSLLAFLFSRPVEYFLSLALGGLQGEPGVHPNHYEVGTIQRLPWPSFNSNQLEHLSSLGLEAVKTAQSLFHHDETSPSFAAPVSGDCMSTIELMACREIQQIVAAIRKIQEIRGDVDAIVGDAFGFSGEDLSEMSSEFDRRFPPAKGHWRLFFGVTYDEDLSRDIAEKLISFLVGLTFERWSISAAQRRLDDLVDKVPQRIAVASRKEHSNIVVLSSHVLLQDLRERMKLIFADAEEMEIQFGKYLSIKSLQAYIESPSGLFSNHLSRYSQFSNGRRSAPVYWPLTTDSGSYTLWVYYNRLTDQTIYTIINDFVEPKHKQVNDDLKSLRSRVDRSKLDEEELTRLSDLATELEDFRKELLRIADFWKPNLNDGVQITAAPLWKFFRLKKWRDTLKKTWEELEAGGYDWAHLALSIWPARVVRTAHKDRSIAIAHDLEELLWHEVEIAKKSKTGKVTLKTEWQPCELSEKDLDAVVEKVKSGEK